jgi:hypothetical protein
MKASVFTLDMRQLEEADAARLRQLWTEINGTAPPKTFTARLMRLALGWDKQARKEGVEPAQTRRVWKRIIKEREKNGSTGPLGCIFSPAVCDGTRLLKEWGGTTHEVLVNANGATWNDQSYTSLSAVARAMTGKNRNGPKFFGLREGNKS